MLTAQFCSVLFFFFLLSYNNTTCKQKFVANPIHKQVIKKSSANVEASLQGYLVIA